LGDWAVKIFIDESGVFVPAGGISVVCSLALPDRSANRVRRELLRLTKDWPRRDGELKGGALQPDHVAQLVDALHRRHAILHCCGIDVSAEDSSAISRHKLLQCEGITKHLTAEHHPNLVEGVWSLRRKLEAMSDQLYVQCIIMTELVCTAIDELVTYFSQRQPREIAEFDWVVDAKNPSGITNQEDWWRNTLGPLIEARSLREPILHRVDDPKFNYVFFDRAFRLEKDMWFPDRPRERMVGSDVRKLLSDRITFAESGTDILLQAVDILANGTRRSLMGKLTGEQVLRSLGKLQILRNRGGGPQTIQLVTLSDTSRVRSGIGKPIREMAHSARTMIR
jgi:hypothetical protein